MNKKQLFCLLAIVVITAKSFSQGDIFVNRVFQESSGSPLFNPILNSFGVQWSNSVRCSTGGIVNIGYTSITGQGQNIYLIKYDDAGNIIFQKDYNSSGTNNDYGLAICEAANGDFLLCGTTDNGATPNYDVFVLRVDNGGNLINYDIKDGPSNLNDVAVSIAEDLSGNILVAANTEDSPGLSDFWVLMYNGSVGFIAANTYNYGLNDITIGMEINASTGDIVLVGPSASGPTACDYAIATFDGSTLAFISDTRSTLPGTALDQAYAFCKDANNNTYITGKSWNGTNFDIKTVKFTSAFALAWSVTEDPNGYEDAGTSIAVDGSGNVIVGGYTTKSNTIKDLACFKYNSSGTQQWNYTHSSQDPTADAVIKKLTTNPVTNDIYFVAGEKAIAGPKQVLVEKISSAGNVRWRKMINDPADDILPSDIKYDADAVFVISVLDSTSNSYLTTMYTELELDTARSFIGGAAWWKKRELLVSFLPNKMNNATVDNESIKFGDLGDFLLSSPYSAVIGALDRICLHCDIKAVKVHDGLKTTDTISISRLGEIVPTPSFWSTLLLQFPSGVDIRQAQKILYSLPGVVSYAQPNNFMVTTSPPNDSLYSIQASIHSVSPNTNAHINVEDAWNITQGCGASFIKGGVFDTGIMWRHKDFGYNGTQTSGKIQGWHFGNGFGPSTVAGGVNIRISTLSIPDQILDAGDHGTRVAGIIGAQRNNTSGVAGIAGGDGSVGNSGVSLYSLNTQQTNMFHLLNAMRASCKADASTPFSYGLNFSNHSYKMEGWWPADSFPLVREVVHYSNRMQVTFVASRGNDGINNYVIPANFDSCWAISVGGSGTNGLRHPSSSYGSGMDVIAPYDSNLVVSTSYNRKYKRFSGTSAATPHVSGVVALLMSYLNDTIDSYKNLAPEDCEFIIDSSATDVGPSGYDSINGYGRLNAGNALRVVEKPLRILYHFGTNFRSPYTITKSVYSNVDTIKLTEKYQALNQTVYNPGKYIVKTFKVDATVSQVHFGTDSLIAYWPRHSSSYVFALPNAQKKLNLHERVKVNSCNFGSASLTGYIYQVKDSTGTALGWWPCDTSFAALYNGNNVPKTLMEYSILVKNKGVGIRENRKENQHVNVYPNPANHEQTLAIQSDKESNCTVQLYDMMGRYIKVVYTGKVNIGKTSITHHLDGLPNGLYIYIIKLDDNTISTKFIKE